MRSSSWHHCSRFMSVSATDDVKNVITFPCRYQVLVSVTVHVAKDSLVIEPKGGISKFAALKRRMRIPIACVKSVDTALVPRSKIYRSVRVGGTALPPHFAGRFYSFGTGLIFLALSDRQKCVTIRLHDFIYREVVVQVDGKEKVAETIKRALSGQR